MLYNYLLLRTLCQDVATDRPEHSSLEPQPHASRREAWKKKVVESATSVCCLDTDKVASEMIDDRLRMKMIDEESVSKLLRDFLKFRVKI